MAFGLISAQGHGICLAANSCPLLTAKTQQQNMTLPLWTIKFKILFLLVPMPMSFLASYWFIVWGWSTNQLFDDSERPHCFGWPLLPRFWKRLRGKRSGSWVNAMFPVTVEQLRALTLALWGLWEPSPRAFRQMLGGHWRVKEDRWMRDSNSTVVCAFRGSDLCGDWKDCQSEGLTHETL